MTSEAMVEKVARAPRTDKHPTEDKDAYGWGAWPPQNKVEDDG